jgi:WD40 repeat protein
MALTFDPGGRQLVSGYADGVVRLWDVPVHYAGSTDQLQTVQFSPNGRLIAAAGRDTHIYMWRPDDPAHPTVLSGHKGIVWRLAFSPDGHTLASASDDGTVRLWSLDDPSAAPHTVVTDAAPMRDVAFSPDGRSLATAGNALRVWDVGDLAAPPPTLNPGPAPALAVTFGPDGHTLAAGYVDAAIDVWDLSRSGTPAQVLLGHTQAVVDLAVSPDGRLLAGASDLDVRLWESTASRADPTQRAPHDSVLRGHTNTVNDVAFTPDGRSLAIAGRDHTLRVWDLDPDILVARICATAGHNLTAASWQQHFRDEPYQAPGCP